MKIETEKKLTRIIVGFGLSISLLTFMFIIYFAVSMHQAGEFSLGYDMKKHAGEGEKYCSYRIIGENRAAVFFDYDCVPSNRIFKGIKKCRGRYYVFTDRTADGWIAEEEKHVMW